MESVALVQFKPTNVLLILMSLVFMSGEHFEMHLTYSVLSKGLLLTFTIIKHGETVCLWRNPIRAPPLVPL